jgi:Lamin Tail Domain
MTINHVRSLSTTLGALVLGGTLVACSNGSPNTTSTAPPAQAVATQAAPTVQALATSGSAAATQGAPTAQALATQAAPTAQALATQAAPTAQALATQAAPTVQAAATQVAPIAATAAANAPVRILGAQSNANDSMISVQNTSASTVDLGGWVLQVGTASAHLPAGLMIQPGQSITLHSSAGTNTSTDVYLGADASSLAEQAKPGARVVLQNPSGAATTAFTIPSA